VTLLHPIHQTPNYRQLATAIAARLGSRDILVPAQGKPWDEISLGRAFIVATCHDDERIAEIAADYYCVR
jgi:hypothetical protein